MSRDRPALSSAWAVKIYGYMCIFIYIYIYLDHKISPNPPVYSNLLQYEDVYKSNPRKNLKKK